MSTLPTGMILNKEQQLFAAEKFPLSIDKNKGKVLLLGSVKDKIHNRLGHYAELPHHLALCNSSYEQMREQLSSGVLSDHSPVCEVRTSILLKSIQM